MLKEKLEKSMTEETNPDTPHLNPEEGLTPSANERFKWYIIHAYSGFERKVTTPSREEVRTTTTVVIVTVFAFAAYFYIVDAVLSRVIQSLLHWLGGVQ